MQGTPGAKWGRAAYWAKFGGNGPQSMLKFAAGMGNWCAQVGGFHPASSDIGAAHYIPRSSKSVGAGSEVSEEMCALRARFPLPVFPKCDTGRSLEVTMILILDEHPLGAAIRLPGHELGRDRKQVGRIPNSHVIPRLRH